jgi:hypothetical protein
VPIHTASDFYDVEGFKAGREPLEAFELEDLGDVSGRSLVHLNDDPGTYTDPDAATVHNRTEEWQHPLGEVLGALIGAGLTLELLGEHDHQAYRQWPFMLRDGSVYRMPEGTPRLPLMYTLRARKPAI